MLNVIKEELLKIVHNINVGNSKLTEEQMLLLARTLKELANMERPLSKYEACAYLNISRSTFDNHVARGWLPKGVPMAGFKELAWYKQDLDEYIKNYKGGK